MAMIMNNTLMLHALHLLLIFFLLLCLSLLSKTTNLYNKKSLRPPGPAPLPIFGSLLTMLRNKPHFRWVLSVADGNDITSISLGTAHAIIVNSPELAREFLKKHDASFASRPVTAATKISTHGFLTVAVSPWGDQWKKMRRILASEAISPVMLRRQTKLRHEEADHLVKYLCNQCHKESAKMHAVVNVRQMTRYYCGNVIKMMMFGQRWFGEEGKRNEGPGREEVEHVEAAFDVLSLIYAFSVSDYVPAALRWLDLDGHQKKMRRSVAVINKYHDPIIEERVRMWRNGERKEVADILDVFISLEDSSTGKPLLTIEEIKTQLAELVYATVDNPSNAVEWVLAHMLDQPDILRKAVDELDRVVGKDRLIQESDFSQLVYIKACAREALRLHPVVAFNLPHVSLSDTNVAGYSIPKGSQVLLSRVGLGRNPKVWSDPLRFYPERHLEGEMAGNQVELNEPDLRFISFTVGRRGCMGSTLGSMMTYMLLARLLHAFEWTMLEEEPRADYLSEDINSLLRARSLHAYAKPRLPVLFMK